MLLTPELASKIASVVGNDAHCKIVLPASDDQKPSRYRGGLRNLGYLLSGKDKDDPDVAARICTGIAEATANAIVAAILSKKLPKSVRSASQSEERTSGLGVNHTATRITLMLSKNKYHDVVFDWHSTLDLWNPLLYRSAESFQSDSGWVHYSMFHGFQGGQWNNVKRGTLAWCQSFRHFNKCIWRHRLRNLKPGGWHFCSPVS